MASNSGHGSSLSTVDNPRSNSDSETNTNAISRRNNVLTNVTGQNLTALGRTVTATAGTLFNDGDPSYHYASTMTDISKQLAHRPSLQKRVFTFNHRSPSELVRSKLSTSEIQYRALTSLPDELLTNIPENDNSYSLFQGFQATLPDEPRGRTTTKGSGRQKLLEDANGDDSGPPTLGKLNHEKETLARKLEMLGVRKNMSSSEIREIDMKIMNLNQMRNIVLDRLAKLEQDEAEVEHEMLNLENKIEDLQEELELASETHVSDDSNADDGKSEESTFMSESIYGKLNSPKQSRKRKSARRISMPILHEHLEPGKRIKEIHTHSDNITGLDFDVPFGTMVTAALDDTVRVWDLNSGRCLGLLEGHQASVRCLQVEDNMVATGSADATIRLWDLSRAESYKFTPPSTTGSIHKRSSATASVSASVNEEDDDVDDDGAHSTMGYHTPSMSECQVFCLDSHVGEVTALYFQGDTLVSGSADKTLRQWDLVKGRCVQTLDVLWAAAQNNMDEGKWRAGGQGGGPDGDFVGALQCFDAALACGTADGMVRLWDLRSGQVHRSLVGHTGPVTCLQFDDVHLVTGSLDRSIRIWDLRTGSIFDAFGYDNPITSMQFDSRRIVSAAGEPVAKVYDKTDGRHWDCGGADGSTEIVERVKVKDGYLVEGRVNGTVGIWAC
ncbi:WD40-repeat-containing domain protein [Morchella snyderi]|nr:WD40-repeat-containing domain protein [Morchella snyderi]